MAQVCQKEGYDWTVMYRNSDLSLAYVSLTDNSLSLRHLNVMAVSNSKKRLELENLKQYILQTNTLGNDLLDITRMMNANSTAEMNQRKGCQILRRSCKTGGVPESTTTCTAKSRGRSTGP